MTATTEQASRSRRLVGGTGLLTIAWFISFLEGYDLAIYGVSIPSIMADESLHLSLPAAGVVGSLVGVGMLVGAAFAGATSHRFGQLRLIRWSIAVFSFGMLLSAVAPSAALFGGGRLITGLGLGVVLPTVNAYVADLSSPGRVARNVGLVMSGYAIGALCAPVLASVLLEVSFRWLYVIGLVPALLLLPVLKVLPNSPAQLRVHGRIREAELIETHYGLPEPKLLGTSRPGRFFGLGALLARGVWRSTLLFWVMSFCGLLLVFGISAWLPTMLQASGYSLGSALLQTAAMWLGVAVGVIVGGRVADVIGPKTVVVAAFTVGTLGLCAMSLQPALWVFYILMFVSGFGFIGSQILGNALIATRYPPELRGNGLPWALSIGRLGAIAGPALGAWVLASSLPTAWNFYAFAVPALVGATAALLVPRVKSEPAPVK
ncbi:MFS transporter [Aeromicrobium sp. CTD01-1L150]|uniref:MFS transporter n=1 Tax=Aeromicrobium sp. CTD01-1L150 TaxID=3341830 RepID=UPI0035C0B498